MARPGKGNDGRSRSRKTKKATARPFDETRARIRLALHSSLSAALVPVTMRSSRLTWLRYLPSLPRRYAPPWRESSTPYEAPESLRTVPGAWRNPDAEDKAAAKSLLYDMFSLYPEALPLLPRYGWAWMLPTTPNRLRFRFRSAEVSANGRQPGPNAAGDQSEADARALSEALRVEAQRVGLSQIGFAAYDPKYAFGPVTARLGADGIANPVVPLSRRSVIVCVMEQPWKVSQTIPSSKAERAVMRTYERVVDQAAHLAELLQSRGFEAQVHGPAGALPSIPYAVEAGLGQLGLNGQLLTPRAGSRCRIVIVTTNAKLAYGSPVDYGIHAICDECQLCVKRCPPGAIPRKRAEHRGVTKAKIKPERCLPTMAQAHGCAVCMKVCPVQRYGLEAVTSHLMQTGEILGKGTDELEGYHWLDGRHYGVGEKPRITSQFLTPDGTVMEPGRVEPPSAAAHDDDAEALAIA